MNHNVNREEAKGGEGLSLPHSRLQRFSIVFLYQTLFSLDDLLFKFILAYGPLFMRLAFLMPYVSTPGVLNWGGFAPPTPTHGAF